MESVPIPTPPEICQESVNPGLISSDAALEVSDADRELVIRGPFDRDVSELLFLVVIRQGDAPGQ